MYSLSQDQGRSAIAFSGARRLGLCLLAGVRGRAVLAVAAVAAAGLLIPAVALGGQSPYLAWSPITSDDTFQFPVTSAGTTSSQTFTLNNVGGNSSGTLNVSVSGASAFTITSDGCTGTALGPNASLRIANRSCSVTVQYAPTSAGEEDAATLNADGEHASTSLSLVSGFAKSQSDCEALGGTFSTDPATNEVGPQPPRTFIWSCNNGPYQAFSNSLIGDCSADGGGNVALAFSQSYPFDSSCFALL